MSKVVLEQQADGVRVIRLADPDHRNAIDNVLRAELGAAVAAVAADKAARVAVLRADGPSFCSGAEVVETFGDADRKSLPDVRKGLMQIYETIFAIRDLEIPTIAAVRGHAVGAGVNLALYCDVRIASRDVAFGLTFSRIGLHPGGGSSYLLMKLLGPQRAMRVLLDGATLNADAALAGGLVDEVVDDPDAAALELARSWAALDPELSRAIKKSIQLAEREGLQASMEHESWAQAKSAQRPEIQRIVAQRRERQATKRGEVKA